jgi:hypothetical protein
MDTFRGLDLFYSPHDGGWYAQTGDWRQSRIYKTKKALVKAIISEKIKLK